MPPNTPAMTPGSPDFCAGSAKSLRSSSGAAAKFAPIYGSMVAMGWARVTDIIMGLQRVQADRDTRVQITQVGRLLREPSQTRPACLDQKPTPAFIDLCASNTLFSDKDLHDVPLWELLEQMAQVAMTKFVYHLPLIEFMSAPWEVTGDSGFVYVAANTHQFGPSNTYKIGRTNDLVRRMDELSRPTGVLGRYRVLFFEPPEDPVALERAVHERLAHCRVEQGKEFFRAKLEEVKQVIRASVRQVDEKRHSARFDQQNSPVPCTPKMPLPQTDSLT